MNNHDPRTDPLTLVRLNRYLAQCGLGSRRACDTIIAAGHVLVNGQPVRELGTKVNPGLDRIEYQGKTIGIIHPLQYFAYHKSRGHVVSNGDPEGRETIYDALKEIGFDAGHLKYVGRLDRNSEGLLILTNDGNLIHALTHPRFEVKKTYRVRIERPLASEDIDAMVKTGIESEGQVLHAGAVRFLAERSSADEVWYEVDLFEGKNRQIRRMFEARGHDVKRLKRIQYGVITLGELQRGRIRELSEREVKGLLNLGYPPATRHGAGRPQKKHVDTSRHQHTGD
jgi:23S rRNA pseudouridine2605 synthase